MNNFLTTDHVIALFPTRIGDPKQFICISQGGTQGALKVVKKVGARFRFALFEEDGAGGSFYDVSNITSIQFLISAASTNYVLNVAAGPFPNLAADTWNNGVKPTAQNFLFQFSSDVMNLAAGVYTLSITGNTDDPLAPVDFYCEATLTVLARADATGNATALTDNDILNAMRDTINAALALKADKIMPPGETITFTSGDGKARRIVGVTNDSILGLQRIDDPEYIS